MADAPDLVAAAERHTPRASLDADTYGLAGMIGAMLICGIVSAALGASIRAICSAADVHVGHGVAGAVAAVTFVACLFGWAAGFLGFSGALIEVLSAPLGAGGHAPGVVLPYCGPAEDRRGDVSILRAVRQVTRVMWYSVSLACAAAGERFIQRRVRAGSTGLASVRPFWLRVAALLMPADQARDWLAEAASILHETTGDQRDAVRRDYLRGAPRVIAVGRARQIRRWFL